MDEKYRVQKVVYYMLMHDITISALQAIYELTVAILVFNKLNTT
jgi:hypothetical protein